MLRGSGKPKPFQRKSIEVSTEAQHVEKAWQDISPREVEVGDIILGKGQVVGLGDVVKHSDPLAYRFEFEMKNGTSHFVEGKIDWTSRVAGSVDVYRFLPTVRAFTRVRG